MMHLRILLFGILLCLPLSTVPGLSVESLTQKFGEPTSDEARRNWIVELNKFMTVNEVSDAQFNSVIEVMKTIYQKGGSWRGLVKGEFDLQYYVFKWERLNIFRMPSSGEGRSRAKDTPHFWARFTPLATSLWPRAKHEISSLSPTPFTEEVPADVVQWLSENRQSLKPMVPWFEQLPAIKDPQVLKSAEGWASRRLDAIELELMAKRMPTREEAKKAAVSLLRRCWKEINPEVADTRVLASCALSLHVIGGWGEKEAQRLSQWEEQGHDVAELKEILEDVTASTQDDTAID